jgi:sensor histidine kinase YesM
LEIILPTITLFPVNEIVLYAVSLVSHENVDVLRSAGGELRILVLFFSKFLFFIICEIVIKLKRKETSSLISFQWLLQILCFVISFYIANTIWGISKQNPVNNYDVLIAFLLIALLNVLLFILLNWMENQSHLQEKYNMAQMNLEAQKQFVWNAQKRYQETRILRHDMKHYLITVAGLISNEKTEEAKAYLETILNEKLPSTSEGIQTGAVAVDSVINVKFSACREQGINVKATLNTDFNGIDEMDMSILLSNLLDNAMNGCKNSDEPKIDLEISRKKSYILIHVRNSMSASVLLDNPDLNTTKLEKSMHGYGIESIRNISSKYDGTVKFWEEGKTFIAEIWLHNREDIII